MSNQSVSPIIFSKKPNNGPTTTFVLSCIDPRFAYATEQYLNDTYTAKGKSYDHFVLAGSALGGGLTGNIGSIQAGPGVSQCPVVGTTFSGPNPSSDWRDTLLDHIQVAITLHNVKEVNILDHLNCGAYWTCDSNVGASGPTGDQNSSIHKGYFDSLVAGITGRAFISRDTAGMSLGSEIFTAGVTGAYFDGYARSPTTTLIDYQGNSITTELKGTNSGAKVLVLGCIDPRYSSVLSSFLREYKDVQFIYDLYITAGASIGVNQSFELPILTPRISGNVGDYPNNILADSRAGIGAIGHTWGPAFLDHLSIARALHQITEVWVFDHLDCGAYKAIHYGDLSDPDLDTEPHVVEMKKLRGNINYYTFGRDPLNPAPYILKFKGFIIDFNGNIRKYIDEDKALGEDGGSNVIATSGINTNSVSQPAILMRDASDYTRALKQSRFFSSMASEERNSTPPNIIQSNQNRLTQKFGMIACGICVDSFPNDVVPR